MKIESFGRTKSGQEAILYTMENSQGMQASVTNYGANLVSLLVPDRQGGRRDVVLGFDSVSGYEHNPSFFGALIAPNANRIGGACFSLKGKSYFLKKNNGENNLHSDEEKGTHKRIWEAAVTGESVCLSLSLKHLDMGFPGNKQMNVIYALTEENELRITYKMTADEETIMNPTNHAYFNLKGHDQGTILDHRIVLLAAHYTPADESAIPTGEIVPVEGTPMDLRQETVIGDKIHTDFAQLQSAAGYDHNWVTDMGQEQIRLIASVKAPDDSCSMKVYTDLPGVQFYTGNFIEEQKGKNGAIYGKRSGLCLETQYYPDSIHQANFPSVVFGPKRNYQSTTIYQFYTD